MALADYAEAALAVLAEPALIVGHSMGAMIALDMAVRHPEMVRGVAALNAVFERDAAAAAAVAVLAESAAGGMRSPLLSAVLLRTTTEGWVVSGVADRSG